VSDLFDALINVDPEPCQDCDTGIQFMTCWDGRKRCRNCVQALGRKFGWDKFELEWDWDSKPKPKEHPNRITFKREDPKLDL
jgi:hypothetical protein